MFRFVPGPTCITLPAASAILSRACRGHRSSSNISFPLPPFVRQTQMASGLVRRVLHVLAMPCGQERLGGRNATSGGRWGRNGNLGAPASLTRFSASQAASCSSSVSLLVCCRSTSSADRVVGGFCSLEALRTTCFRLLVSRGDGRLRQLPGVGCLWCVSHRVVWKRHVVVS